MDEQTAALVTELELQRAWALTRCTQLVQEVVKRDQRIRELEQQLKEGKDVG